MKDGKPLPIRMTADAAWRLIGERAKSTAKDDGELLAICEALAILADRPECRKQQAETLHLIKAMEDRDAAQLRFNALFGGEEKIGGLGE